MSGDPAQRCLVSRVRSGVQRTLKRVAAINSPMFDAVRAAGERYGIHALLGPAGVAEPLPLRACLFFEISGPVMQAPVIAPAAQAISDRGIVFRLPILPYKP